MIRYYVIDWDNQVVATFANRPDADLFMSNNDEVSYKLLKLVEGKEQ